MTWLPTTVREVEEIVAEELTRCSPAQLATFRQYAVSPHNAPILRYGNMEHVVVVARKGEQVIYWGDVEEGFEVSRISPEGIVLEHGCNQDFLGLALNNWLEPLNRECKFL